MPQLNIQQNNSLSSEEIQQIVHYFELLGYKADEKTINKLQEFALDYPDRDFVRGAREMYEWFSEAEHRGRKIKSYHSTFRNWMRKDYAPKKQKTDNPFNRSDLY